MSEAELSQKSEFYEGFLIFTVGFLAALLGFRMNLGFYLSVILAFTMACINWWRMDRKNKSVAHMVVGACSLFFLFWVSDRYGQRALPNNYFLYHALALFFIPVLLNGYLAIATERDIKLFTSLGAQPLPEKRWHGCSFLIFIFVGAIILTLGLNYGASALGLCKFPPAYELFSPDVEPREGVAIGLISSYDFECKWYKNERSNEFTPKYSEEIPIIYEQEFYRYISGDYAGYDNDVWAEQYIWVMKDKVTETDIQTILDFRKDKVQQEEINVQIDKVEGAKFQDLYCYDYIGYACDVVIGFNNIITRIRVVGYDQTSLELFQEAVRIATAKTGQRLFLIDSNLK